MEDNQKSPTSGVPAEEQTFFQNLFSRIDSKIGFLFGLILGVALMSTVGFASLLIVPNAISQKSNNQDTLAEANKNLVVEENNPQPTGDDPSEPSEPQADASKVTVNTQDHIKGDVNAPVTIIEFSDFQCPFCSRFHPDVKKLVDSFPGKVRWIFKHFPLSFHPNAQPAAEASECAAEQGKFWEYSEQLFLQQDKLGETDFYKKVAQEQKLNVNQFTTCYTSGKYKAKVQADYQMGVNAGVSGTPGTFINSTYIPGAKGYDELVSIVNSY